MNIFKPDPVKKALKDVPKDKAKVLEKELFESYYGDVLLPDDPPETWQSVIKVYAAALQHDKVRPRMTGAYALHKFSSTHLHHFKSLGEIVTAPMRQYLFNTSADFDTRFKCAIALARIEGAKSLDTIRPFLDTVPKQNTQHLSGIIEITNLLGLPGGKELAYQAIDVYQQYQSMNGIMYASQAFASAVNLLVSHADGDSIEYLGKLINTFAKRLGSMSQYSMAQMDVPKEGLQITSKALATSTDSKCVEILVDFVKWASSQSARGRQLSQNQVELLPNILAIRKTARDVIKIWQASSHNSALSLLNESLGTEEVKAFIDSKE